MDNNNSVSPLLMGTTAAIGGATIGYMQRKPTVTPQALYEMPNDTFEKTFSDTKGFSKKEKEALDAIKAFRSEKTTNTEMVNDLAEELLGKDKSEMSVKSYLKKNIDENTKITNKEQLEKYIEQQEKTFQNEQVKLGKKSQKYNELQAAFEDKKANKAFTGPEEFIAMSKDLETKKLNLKVWVTKSLYTMQK